MRNLITDECIHVIDEKQQQEDVAVVYHGFGGKEVKDTDKWLAKKTANGCFLRFATTGLDAGRLFNPHSPNHPTNISWESLLGSNGKYQYEPRKVTEAAYSMYIQYLKSGDPIYLRQAEREI